MQVANSTGEIRQNGSNSSNGVLWFGGNYTNASYGNYAACAVNYSSGIPDCYVSIRIWATATSVVSSYDMMWSQTENSYHMGINAGGASQQVNNILDSVITYNSEGSNAGIAYSDFQGSNRRSIIVLQNLGAVQSSGNFIVRVLSDAIQYISVSWF